MKLFMVCSIYVLSVLFLKQLEFAPPISKSYCLLLLSLKTISTNENKSKKPPTPERYIYFLIKASLALYD